MKRRYDSLFRQRRRRVQDAVPLAMPHERDEAAERDLPRREVVVQAHRDLAQGQVDTDNYTRVAPITAPVSTRRGGMRRRP
ncbi:MAG: hypothetical protein U1F48_11625 [Burkholderiales bacterium]